MNRPVGLTMRPSNPLSGFQGSLAFLPSVTSVVMDRLKGFRSTTSIKTVGLWLLRIQRFYPVSATCVSASDIEAILTCQYERGRGQHYLRYLVNGKGWLWEDVRHDGEI